MGKAQGKDELIGQVIGGRYQVVRLIGRGGMGAIYEVVNTRLGRSFAMKILIGEGATDDDVLSRFRREADVIARIKHPNIVEVIDWEALDDGSPCIILEYLQGEDLARRIREAAPLPWPVIARIGDHVLNALSVAHAANIVHRDLKPQNIFLAHDDSGDERAKLLDFGVSKIRDSESLVTTDARLLGTPSYMAPEQAEGRHEDVGPATDLWAMGAILYEMATGDLAFDGASMPAVLYKICSKEVESVDARRADAPAAFVTLIRDALARDLHRRIGDADVFRVRLREALSSVASVRYSDQVLAPRPSPSLTPQTNPTPRRKRQTGAHDETVSGKLGGAPTGDSFDCNTPTLDMPISGDTPVGETLPRVRRRARSAAIGLGAAALALTVLAVVIASSHAPPPIVAARQVAPPADAGLPRDAVIAPMPDPPRAPTPAPKRSRPRDPIVKRDPPSRPPVVPRVEPPAAESRPANKCDKRDPDYWLCINGEDR